MPRKTKQNKITSPELLSKVNPGNMKLKRDFLEYLRSVQRSPKTIEGYDSDLEIVLVWNYLHNDDKDFTKISKRDWAAFQNWAINENGNSPARVRRLKSAVSSLSNFIANVLDDEPEFRDYRPNIRKIENPVLQPVREKTVWTDEEIDGLLRRLSDCGEHKKACILALAAYSGRRKAELPRFRVDDFKDENLVCGGALYKTSAPIQTKGFGMGKFIYCYTLAKKFKPYFDAWMKQREELGIESEWLLPDEKNPSEPIKVSALNSFAKTLSRMSGRDVYMHSFRHSFTSSLALQGIPDNVIQKIVGWEDISMVGVYKDIDAEHEISMYFDENGDVKTEGKKSLSDL